MILQCDQCQTKFRLDDAKLKPGGVKVRCSKCRHVFVAGVEAKAEESDFDQMLAGLEAQAPAAAAPPPETAAPGAPKPAGEQEGDFAFDFDDALGVATAAPGSEAKTAGAPEEADSFDFSFETTTLPQQAAGFETSSFEFSPEPVAPLTQPEQKAEDAAPFGEFSFDEEPPALREETPQSPAAPAFEFGEFSFDTEPAAQENSPAAAAAPTGFESPPVKAQETPVAAAEDFDFADFTFNEEPPQLEEPALKEEAAPAAGVAATPTEPGAFDFGDFSFEETAQAQEVTPPQQPSAAGKETSAAESVDFGAFSFDEEPIAFKEEPLVGSATTGADFPFGAPPATPVAPAAPPSSGAAGAGSGGAFSFDDDVLAGAKSSGAAAAAGGPAAGAARPGAAASAPETAGREGDTSLDFFGTPGPDAFDDEALPPLSISSRRKGRSWLTIAIVAVSVLVIVALSGAGFYLMKSGPAAFDTMGLGFLAQWFGVEGAEEGKITVKNPQAAFYQNPDAGELFVVTGDAVNSFRRARASIRVKVSLYGKNGAVVAQKFAYCGNRLSKEQLSTLPMAKLDSIMNNPFGDSLSNLGVPPGGSIGFVVAVPSVPKDAVDFGVEVVSSTVAGK